MRNRNSRSGRIVAQTVFWLIELLVVQQSGAPTSDKIPSQVTSVDAIEMTVADIDRSTHFFTKVLGFKEIFCDESQEGRRQTTLQLGDERLLLTQYLGNPGRPMPADSRTNDHWFQHVAIIVSDMDRAYERLREFKVKHASSGPQTLPAWNTNAAGIKAFYFRDPDGHFLEILQFPFGKGDPKWQRKDDLFLGLDHTAIVVADTEKSLAFYRDQLGLRVAGSSENYGVEQEHLNGVFGARLLITTLRASQGPGIELLEYISPTDGRSFPNDVQPADILNWRILVSTNSVAPGSADSESNLANDEQILSTKACRDPDGHSIQLLERKGR